MITRLILFLLLVAMGPSASLAASDCPSNEELRFADGTSACASEYKFFTIKRRNANEGLLKKLPSTEAGPRMPHFSIAINKNLAQCPTSWVANWGGGPNYPTSRFALGECEEKIKEQAQKSGINSALCGCEVLYEASSNGPNVPFAKKDFEEKAKAWVAFVQDQEFFRDQFSKEERDANAKFFSDYKSRFLALNNSLPQTNTGLVVDSGPVVSQTQSQSLTKIAQQENEQKELAQKQKREAELQAQAEKERKLAEEKRLQLELAEKLKVEKEQKLAEDKRIKEELAKLALQEKDQKELAQKQKKEAELKAIAAAQSEKYTFAGKKIALVMGNAKYAVHPLDNPKNDADDISRALKGVGFEVIDVRDATLSQMRSAIRSFGDKLLNNDVGLVYYSGHGIEVKGRNYFIPVNADIKRSDEIADQSIDVGLILDKMETAQKPVNILIVDACRDDPFGRSFRSGSRGLATMDAPQGTIIAFATSPGKVAADGDGRNSPYTKNLVLAMQEPNVPIEQVFKKVRRAVQQETKNQQTPWENTSLSGDFYFKVQRQPF